MPKALCNGEPSHQRLRNWIRRHLRDAVITIIFPIITQIWLRAAIASDGHHIKVTDGVLQGEPFASAFNLSRSTEPSVILANEMDSLETFDVTRLLFR